MRWVEDGKRRRRYCSSQDEADAAAEQLRVARGAHAADWRNASPAEQADVLAVWRSAKEHGTTLPRVWADWLAGHRGAAADCPTVGVAMKDFLQVKTSAQRSERYMKSLKSALKLFAAGREAVKLSTVTPSTVVDWLGACPVKARASYLSRLSTFFAWAVRHEHIRRNPCERVELPRQVRGTPPIFTIRQAARVLAWARRQSPRAVPALVLSMLAGLRPEEALRTDWKAIDLEAGLIRVEAQTSKVRQRRVVYPMPSAVAWLRWAKDNGGELPFPRMGWTRLIRRLRVLLKLDRWPQDITRHTAASYWLAVEGNAYTLAEALGHSPAILKTHYRALVTRQEAERFWRMMPTGPERRAAASGSAGPRDPSDTPTTTAPTGSR